MLGRTGRERTCQHFREVTSNPSGTIVSVNFTGTTRLIMKSTWDLVKSLRFFTNTKHIPEASILRWGGLRVKVF